MTKHPFDEEVTDTFVMALLTALAQGPIGEALLGLASGDRQIVVKEAKDRAGWVIRTEPVSLPPHDATTDSDWPWAGNPNDPRRTLQQAAFRHSPSAEGSDE